MGVIEVQACPLVCKIHKNPVTEDITADRILLKEDMGLFTGSRITKA